MAFGHSMILYSHLHSSNGKVSLVAHKLWAQLWLKGKDLYETFYLFVLACSHKYHPLPSIAIYVGKALDMFSLRVIGRALPCGVRGSTSYIDLSCSQPCQLEWGHHFIHPFVSTKQVFVVVYYLFGLLKMSLNLNEPI